MSTIEATKQDQESKRDLKIMETDSIQKVIEIVNNNRKALDSSRKNVDELIELLRHCLIQLEGTSSKLFCDLIVKFSIEPLISQSIAAKMSIISDLEDLPRFKQEIGALLHDDTITNIFKCCYDITLDPRQPTNAAKVSSKITPILLDTTGLTSFELITTTINCSTTIARIIAHCPYLFDNVEQENGSASQLSNGSEELAIEEYKAKLFENKKLIEKLQNESEVKSSLIEVLVNKMDALEKQEKMSTTISDLSKSDISYLNSSEVVSDDESQKSDEMPHIKINDNYLNSSNGPLNGHLSLPVSPMKVDPSQDWAVKEKKYLEHIRKLENKLNSTQTKKRKEEIERLRKKLVESEQQRRSLSNELKNMQKQVQMSQRRSSTGSASNNTPSPQNNKNNNSQKNESQSSSADQSYDSVSKSDNFNSDINIEKAKDNIEVKMLTIDEEEYTNLQYLLFTWMVVALKLTAMAEGRSPQNIDKQMLFQKAMDNRLDYASWPALIMEHIK